VDHIVDVQRIMMGVAFFIFYSKSCRRVLGQGMTIRPKALGFNMTRRDRVFAL